MIVMVKTLSGEFAPRDAEVVILGGGVGTTACNDCEGHGTIKWWHPDPNLPDSEYECVKCKTTGKIYIMAY